MIRFQASVLWACAWIVLTVSIGKEVAHAQPNGRKGIDSNSPSVFDRITLKNRKTILGIHIGRDGNDQSLIAVRRGWLENNEPSFPKLAAESLNRERIAYTQIRDRLTDLLKSPDDWPNSRLLEEERSRAEQWLADENPPPSQLFFLSYPSKEILRIESPGRLELQKAQWAWFTGLENPESSSSATVTKQLEKEHVPWQTESPELGDRFPARPQDEKEWSARLALFQYSHVEAVSFQGTNDLMIRTDKRNTPIDFGPIVSHWMKSQVQSQLHELASETTSSSNSAKSVAWLRTAKIEAEKIDKNYVRATAVAADPKNGDVVVETGFALRLPHGQWEAIWTARETQNANQQNRDSIERIENDPQIESLRKALTGLGVGADNEQIQHALRIGAATMNAQQRVDFQFEKLRQRYMKRLDLPLLIWEPITVSE